MDIARGVGPSRRFFGHVGKDGLEPPAVVASLGLELGRPRVLDPLQ